MKILVQSDDYGFTKSVVDGMCDAFANGIITATGLFANMPWVDYAVAKMKEHPHICFGIDINIMSGPCVSDPTCLPTLVNQATGEFVQTSERMKDPRWFENVDIFKPYEECYCEAKAQVDRFIAMTGKKPGYLTSHSTSGSKTYLKAIGDVAHEYNIKFSYDMYEKYGFIHLFPKRKEGDPYSYENQTMDRILPMLELLEANKDKLYVMLPSHCGYVDRDLMRYTRCNIDRAFDHAMLVSPEIKQWITDHHAELISYNDLEM